MGELTDERAGEDVLARLAAMQARLDEQAAMVARLMATTPGAASWATAPAEPRPGRRGMLTKALGATAAAALLAVAKEAAPAHADSRTTLTAGGASTNNYGILSTYGAGIDPATQVPALGSTTHGVLGTYSAAGPSPTRKAGVTGIGSQSAGVVGVQGVSTDAAGVFGKSTAAEGVFGESTNHNGVGGTSTNFSGVIGIAGSAGPGLGAPFGVVGTSIASVGMFGSSMDNIGVRALSTNNVGVFAESGANTGVYASSPARGVWGRTTNGIGVFGQATHANGFGVYGAAPTAPGTWAGYFEGHVYVSGGLANGAVSTSAAPSPDGSLRTLYSVDSAEPVVEDFGEGQLVGGKADVMFDPEFAAVAGGSAYQVFLTEYGDLGTLYVADRTPTRFEVRSRTGASGGFGYRVVAKRKGASGKRLERLERPRGLSARELEPPTLPEPPTRPQAPPTRPEDRSERRPPISR